MQTWTRAVDQRTVTLVGVSHLAEAGYYRAVLELIRALQAGGALVHHERVAVAGAEERAACTELERGALDVLDYTMSLVARIGHATGLMSQKDGVPAGEDWVNTDTTEVTLVRLLGPRRIVDALSDKRLPAVVDLLAGHRLGRAGLRWLMRNLGRLQRFSVLAGDGAVAGLDNRVVVDWRNAFAVTAALAAPAGSHVVAVWGALHLPGIGDSLQDNDFVLGEVSWYTAIAPRWTLRRRGELAAGGIVDLEGGS